MVPFDRSTLLGGSCSVRHDDVNDKLLKVGFYLYPNNGRLLISRPDSKQINMGTRQILTVVNMQHINTFGHTKANVINTNTKK